MESIHHSLEGLGYSLCIFLAEITAVYSVGYLVGACRFCFVLVVSNRLISNLVLKKPFVSILPDSLIGKIFIC